MNHINTLSIEPHQGELRADSRKIAEALGVEHKAVIQLLNIYKNEFESLGLLRFEMEAVKKDGYRGTKKTKFLFLNEDHAYLLLTMTRNNSKNLPLKVRLIGTFKAARQKIRLLSESSASALKSVIPSNQYGEPSKSNGMPKVSIRNSCFYAAKNPKATKLKQAHEVFQITEQLSFFWLLTEK